MAATSTPSALNEQKWSREYAKEYVRKSQFARLIGTGVTKPFRLQKDLTKGKGDQVTVPFVLNLSGAGVTGDNTLAGNEEALLTYGHKITVDQLRNGVLIGKHENLKSAIDMPTAAREALQSWSQNKLRSDILAALGSAKIDGSTAYASCTEPEKDAWLLANTDRVLFGAAKSNNASNDHSAALLNIDSSNDTLSAAIVSLAKRMAKLASPKIAPISVGEMGEFYVMLCQSYAFRDLKANLSTIHQNAGVRGDKNPLFVDGDLLYDNVLIKEVEEISVISGVGAGSPAIDVAPCYLIGQSALGIAWAEMPHAVRRKEDDYENLVGVGVAETRGIDKLMSNNVQFGVLTLYVSGVADT